MCGLYFVRVPGEIDGQVNDLSSVLVSAQGAKKKKNHQDSSREKHVRPKLLSEIFYPIVTHIFIIFLYYYIVQRNQTLIMEKKMSGHFSIIYYVIYLILFSLHKEYVFFVSLLFFTSIRFPIGRWIAEGWVMGDYNKYSLSEKFSFSKSHRVGTLKT